MIQPLPPNALPNTWYICFDGLTVKQTNRDNRLLLGCGFGGALIEKLWTVFEGCAKTHKTFMYVTLYWYVLLVLVVIALSHSAMSAPQTFSQMPPWSKPKMFHIPYFREVLECYCYVNIEIECFNDCLVRTRCCWFCSTAYDVSGMHQVCL